MNSPDSSVAALLLVNRLTEVDDAKPLSAREYWELLKGVPDPAAMLGLTCHELQALGLDASLADRIVRLLDASIPFAFERERLESGGIQVVSTFDDQFPSRLRSRLADGCPAFLLIAGSASHVNSGGLGIVGSRNVSPAGAQVAESAAASAAARGEAVVSGLARGVDQIAMAAALQGGGLVTGVPSEGLSKVARAAEVRRYVVDDRLCLISPYGPDSPFSAGNAMGRNKIIYALADTTLVIATDKDTGGTWAGATEALRRGYGAVAVWIGDGAGPGNTALTNKGAIPIHDLAELAQPLEPAGQLTLEDFVTTPECADERKPEIPVAASDEQDDGVIPPASQQTDEAAKPGPPEGGQPTRDGDDVRPTGLCWCGCGAEVSEDQFFAPRHDAKAATDAAVALFGSVEAFLAANGFRDSNPPPARKPSRSRHKSK